MEMHILSDHCFWMGRAIWVKPWSRRRWRSMTMFSPQLMSSMAETFPAEPIRRRRVSPGWYCFFPVEAKSVRLSSGIGALKPRCDTCRVSGCR